MILTSGTGASINREWGHVAVTYVASMWDRKGPSQVVPRGQTAQGLLTHVPGSFYTCSVGYNSPPPLPSLLRWGSGLWLVRGIVLTRWGAVDQLRMSCVPRYTTAFLPGWTAVMNEREPHGLKATRLLWLSSYFAKNSNKNCAYGDNSTAWLKHSLYPEDAHCCSLCLVSELGAIVVTTS